eukprot:Seg1828.9 transcript_id=Seg1828.9/GoldUCD/mRNA.D3Y31 product="Zinc finger and SCAN domain-containing protein 22" protein_id=Seg1828.9/GoldUCD/D3Y31
MSNFLSLHLQGKKKHVCEICGHAFSKRCNLQNHLRIHRGERPHACDLCSRSFTTLGDLVRHSRTHSGEKPYKCDKCSRSFADFGSHRRHQRLHTNQNPHKCHVCSRAFSRLDSYKNHMNTHATRKPYVCEVCRKDFAYRSTYKRHLALHSGEKKFSCDICGKRFFRQDYLACHKKTHDKRTRTDSNASSDSEINITESELMLCPNSEIERNASFSVNDDLFPIPILLSMAESAVVNVNMCDGTSCLDSSVVLAADNEIELGTSSEIPTTHYGVSIDLESSPEIPKSPVTADGLACGNAAFKSKRTKGNNGIFVETSKPQTDESNTSINSDETDDSFSLQSSPGFRKMSGLAINSCSRNSSRKRTATKSISPYRQDLNDLNLLYQVGIQESFNL